jgi:glycosyltransferase involved in cell wall biosynthesis
MADKRVAICTPALVRPTQHCLDSLEKASPVLQAAGWTDRFITEIGCPYISHARATMLRKALDDGADVIVFLDYDLSFEADAILRLIETEDDCCAGLYRFKKDEEEYMGVLDTDASGFPRVRHDGALYADKVPAGFLKLTKEGVRKYMRAWPELLYGDPERFSVDLFNHGAHGGVWYGEDYAFSRRWRERCGEIMVVPDLSLTHHSSDKAYPGNFHNFLRRQPGGDLAEA